LENKGIHVLRDERAVAIAVATQWQAIARAAVDERNEFHVALTGGSTPRPLYRLLATAEWQQRIDWHATQVYFGDERCVPPEHPDSNYRMANETLLSKCPLTPRQVHRIQGEREPQAAARAYAGVLRDSLARFQGRPRPPRFDLLLLGVGIDGHIASLFPGSPLLNEREEWVGAAYIEHLRAWRISLTYPILNMARHTLLIVTGAAKAGIVRRVLRGQDRGAEPLPVERLAPEGGVEWFLDREAAAGLEPGTYRED
jgi:6-phosphogluconolactonase